jgi:hypothetical protein
MPINLRSSFSVCFLELRTYTVYILQTLANVINTHCACVKMQTNITVCMYQRNLYAPNKEQICNKNYAVNYLHLEYL